MKIMLKGRKYVELTPGKFDIIWTCVVMYLHNKNQPDLKEFHLDRVSS